MLRKTLSLGIAAAVAVAVSACGDTDADESSAGTSLPQGSEPAGLDPADFSTEIDHPYWPMTPGSRWVYAEKTDEATQKVVVTVTDETKVMPNGVEARVVHDVVSEQGEPIEVTDDYYAQDSEGTIWYLGEETAEYENGEVSTREGSFEAGADGAEAGVILPGDPQVGQSYRQEYKQGEAEDQGKILSLDETAEVPFGSFEATLETEDTNPLEQNATEHKYYARDVGPVLTLDVSGGGEERLVSYEPG